VREWYGSGYDGDHVRVNWTELDWCLREGIHLFVGRYVCIYIRHPPCPPPFWDNSLSTWVQQFSLNSVDVRWSCLKTTPTKI